MPIPTLAAILTLSEDPPQSSQGLPKSRLDLHKCLQMASLGLLGEERHSPLHAAWMKQGSARAHVCDLGAPGCFQKLPRPSEARRAASNAPTNVPSLLASHGALSVNSSGLLEPLGKP